MSKTNPGLPEQIADAIAGWAYAYPIASWGLASGVAAMKLSETWGSSAANAVLIGGVQRRFDEQAAEIEELRSANAKLTATIEAFPDANSAANLAHARAERDQLRATLARVRRMAQVWIDMRPDYPTATREGHGIAYAGEQVVAAIDQPAETKEG